MVQQREILTAAKFYLELSLDGSDANTDAVFRECQGFQRSQDAIDFAEVSPNKWGKASKGQVIRTKLPGNVKSGNITLRRGMSDSMVFWKWFQAVQDGNWAAQRKDASLTIYDQGGKAKARFNLTGAFPTRYKLSDVDARSHEIEVEELEVAFEGFERTGIG
ncbi:phage tail protein [Pseudanabaenaceae cyanobacterium LEGE 13415]|nr:phage tail protein [Pseudanabaenaceae cyanobacterium LEGE 13415]